MYTARLSSARDLLWEKELDFDGHNQSSAGVAVAADGSIFAVGQDESARVHKYTADGAIAWTASYERSTPYEHVSARHAFLDRDGNLVVVGTAYAGGNDPDWYFVRKYVNRPALDVIDQTRVLWTKDFTGDAAMNVEQLVWVPNGALAVLGRGKRMLQGTDYRYDTRLRAVMPDGVDLGTARFVSVGDFHNEPTAIAVSPTGIAHVLGWQYWSGDGWNDENVMRLRISVQK